MKVSIITSVYNSAEYLKEAVDSVLQQTFADFEWIIVNDATKDDSIEIIESYNDPRIKVFHNEVNLGLAASLNKAIAHASGEYLVRMDTDDICIKDRIERQVAFMEANREITVAGSWVKLFGEWNGIWKTAELHDEIKVRLMFNSALAHPSVIMRRQVMEDHKLYYNEDCKKAQDYELWVRAIDKMKFANIPEVLLYYRVLPSAKTAEVVKYANGIIYNIRNSQLQKLGLDFSPVLMDQLHYISANQMERADPKLVANLIREVLKANGKKSLYNQRMLQKIMGRMWVNLFRKKPGAIMHLNSELIRALFRIF